MTTDFRIETMKGSRFEFTEFDGGTLKSPNVITSIDGNETLRLINFGGFAIGLLPNNDLGYWDIRHMGRYPTIDEAFYFTKISSRGPIVTPIGFRHSGNGWIDLILDPSVEPGALRPTTKLPLSDQFHFIEPGGMLLFLLDHSVFQEPTREHRDAVKLAVLAYNHFPLMLEKSPRLQHFLSRLTDNYAHRNAQGQDRDLGWLLRFHNARTGSSQKTQSWFWSYTTRDEAGIDNWRYNKVMHILWNYLFQPNQAANSLLLGLAGAFIHASMGKIHAGKFKGMNANEKGVGFHGDGENPIHEKCFDWNLLFPYLLFRYTPANPIFEPFVEELIEYRVNQDEKKVWPNGEYDNRPMAHYLENVLALILIRSDLYDQLAPKLANRLDQVFNLWDDATKSWPNPASTPKGQSTPYMGFQLIASVMRVIEFRPAILRLCKTAIDINWILDRAEEYHANAWESYWYDQGIFCMKYRINPYQVGTNIHRTAFALPVYRRLAAHRPGVWLQTFLQMEAFILKYCGSTPQEALNGLPDPLSAIGYDYPNEGLGFMKVISFYLEMGR